MARFVNPRDFINNLDISGEVDRLVGDISGAFNDFNLESISRELQENLTIAQLDILPRATEAFNINVQDELLGVVPSNIPHFLRRQTEGLSATTDWSTVPPLSSYPIDDESANSGSGTRSLPLPNNLRPYTHYNYIITLAALTDEELNLPDQTIRQRPPANIVMRSTGGAGDNKALTASEINGNKIEFFIDDLEVKNIITPNSRSRHASATNIRFQVTEPYSMGLLPQALELACLNAGQGNYLEAPMAIIIEFVGYTDSGLAVPIPNSRRVISCRWVSGSFQAGQSGSVYEMVMVPYNELAFSDIVQNTPIDVSLSGRTLNEMLQTGFNGLASTLNTHLLTNQENTYVHEQDEYIFVFPKDKASFNQILENNAGDQGATTSGNGTPQQRTFDRFAAYESMKTGLVQSLEFAGQEEIDRLFADQAGFSMRRSNLSEAIKQYNENNANVNSMGQAAVRLDDPLGPGANPYISTFYERDEETGLFVRDNITIDPVQRQIKFKQGEKIQRIIEELVCISDAGIDIGPNATPDELGMVPWFRIETQVFNVNNPRQESQGGRKPRIYVYRMVPYKVHHSVFAAPNAPYTGYDNLAAQAAKEYDYIYTGKNDDVLDFNLEFKNTFYAALAPDGGNRSNNNTAQDSARVDDGLRGAASDVGQGTRGDGATSERNAQGPAGAASAGATAETAAVRTARRFNDAIVNSDTDLISANMTIWGDPFWLADSGMGNYMARATNLFNVNSDEQADYQNGQNDILINFRTPVDLKDNGFYSFPQEFVNVDNFSGLYMVISVTNMFQRGKFTQDLQLIRRRNQRIASQATDQNVSPVQELAVPERLIAELSATGATPEQIEQLIDRNIQQFGTLNIQDIVANIPGVSDIQGTVGNIFGNIGLDQAGIDAALSGINNLQGEFNNALSGLNDIQGQIAGLQGQLEGAVNAATQQVQGAINTATQQAQTALNTATTQAQNAINNITGGIG